MTYKTYKNTVKIILVSVKNLNYVLSYKTNEDFLCNGGRGYSHIKKSFINKRKRTF